MAVDTGCADNIMVHASHRYPSGIGMTAITGCVLNGNMVFRLRGDGCVMAIQATTDDFVMINGIGRYPAGRGMASGAAI